MFFLNLFLGAPADPQRDIAVASVPRSYFLWCSCRLVQAELRCSEEALASMKTELEVRMNVDIRHDRAFHVSSV